MRASLAAVLLATLTASAALAGCIGGAFHPAEIPAPALAQGWRLDASRSTNGTEGIEPIVRARWQANVYRDDADFQGRAAVVSVSDVPLLDEQAEIRKRIDPMIAEFGATLTERSRGSGNIGPDVAQYVIYDVVIQLQQGRATGLGIEAKYVCSANGEHVNVFGFAITEATIASTIPGFGGAQRTDPTQWQELAGGADRGQLGGMVVAVRCSP